jgi:hypothetical protein
MQAPLSQPDAVAARVNPDIEFAAEIQADPTFAVQAYGFLEVAVRIMHLQAHLAALGAVRLYVHADHLRGLRPGTIVGHLDVHTQGDARSGVEYFRMQAAGPTTALFVQPRADHAGIAFDVLRAQMGVHGPRK